MYITCIIQSPSKKKKGKKSNAYETAQSLFSKIHNSLVIFDEKNFNYTLVISIHSLCRECINSIVPPVCFSRPTSINLGQRQVR